MNSFAPGSLRLKLQDKIKAPEDKLFTPPTPGSMPAPGETEPPAPQIKNTDPAKFAQAPSTYAANEMRSIQGSIRFPTGTAQPPPSSIIHESVHERMQNFVKDQYAKK